MCKVGLELNRIVTSQHARGIGPVSNVVGLQQHAEKQMTNCGTLRRAHSKLRLALTLVSRTSA